MTIWLIVGGFALLLLGFLLGHLLLTAKVREKNQEIEKEEQQAQLRIKDLEREYIERSYSLDQQYEHTMNQYIADYEEQNKRLEQAADEARAKIIAERAAWDNEKTKKIVDWAQRESDLKSEVSGLERQIEEKKRFINDLEDEVKTTAGSLESTVYDLMSVNMESQGKALEYKYEVLEKGLEVNYAELTDEFLKQSALLDSQILEKENRLDELRAKTDAAVAANKRAELERQEKDFYRLQLDEIDLEEIQRIKSIEPYLRKKEPLNKVIWKVYYEKPYTDLIGRVVGPGRKCGIYKITNIENGMCYIGQAVDIADRWKQHIKRGVGADPPTQNKLYPAMLSIGVENFTFEIIEQCDSKLLNSREDYWQDFYHAKDFGYSIK